MADGKQHRHQVNGECTERKTLTSETESDILASADKNSDEKARKKILKIKKVLDKQNDT